LFGGSSREAQQRPFDGEDEPCSTPEKLQLALQTVIVYFNFFMSFPVIEIADFGTKILLSSNPWLHNVDVDTYRSMKFVALKQEFAGLTARLQIRR
jgi:hypothetical protein